MNKRPLPRLARGALGLALASMALVVAPVSATAAVVNTPVWIGAGYNGGYGAEGTQPGSHGGDQVAFDFFAPAGTAVNIYAAPRNNALNNNITAHIIETGVSTVGGVGSAATCGYYARVELRHDGNSIGMVSFHHLAAPPARGQISRWGGRVGTIGNLPLNSGAACYQVSTPQGRHSHIEFRNYGFRPACAQDYGQVSKVATNYQGYLGDYGKAPLAGNRCPGGI